MTRSLVALLLLAGCSEQAVSDLDGPNAAGGDGAYDGPQHCWDLDYDGEADPDEDTNGDGTVDVYDCRGEDGGGSGNNGSDGQDCWDLDGDGIGDPEEDTNGDGVVDVYDCRDEGSDDTGGGGAGYLGDLHLSSGQAVTEFCNQYTYVLGDLLVDAEAAEIDLLDCLEYVLGSCFLNPTDDAAGFSLERLVLVEGNLLLSAHGSVDLPMLEQVGLNAEFQLHTHERDADLTLPSLVEVGTRPGRENYLNIRNSDGSLSSETSGYVIDADMPVLERVSGPLWLDTKSLQDADGFVSLDYVGGDLKIQSNNLLRDVTGLHNVTFVGGGVSVTRNRSLPTSAAEALVAEIDVIGGTVTIEDNGPG